MLGAISVVTFLVYAIDKSRAKRGKWRVPEKTLLMLSFFGGGLGGITAMYLLRHKTKHWYFTVINCIGVILQACAIVACASC